MEGHTKIDLTKMKSLYESGLSMSRVAQELGCSTSNVKHHLVRLGVDVRPPKRIDWPIEDMRRWYEVDGLSLQEIADRLGQPQKGVNKVAKRSGFVMRCRGMGGYPPERHPCWKGGRIVDKYGYVLIHQPEHPLANSGGYVREHRLVAEKTLGRHLLPTEVVHHVNDDTSDNRPENLVVFDSNGEHLAETLAGRCPQWTEDGKKRLVAAARKPRVKKRSRLSSALDGQGSP